MERVEGPIIEAFLRDIYLIVHKALVNTARHAQASVTPVGVEEPRDQVRNTVADNGHGFRFHGRYDYTGLADLKLGPVTLKERIAALQRSIAIDSNETGAHLEITMPFAPP